MKVFIAGQQGFVGTALTRSLGRESGIQLVSATRSEVNFLDQNQVEDFLQTHRPDSVINASGRVGGILANQKYAAEFIHENLVMQTHLIHGAWKAGVKRLIHFGAACMYPRDCPQPMHPAQIHRGPVEPTSEPYAMSKLAGMTMCQAYSRQYGVRFRTLIPSNLYGPGEDMDPEKAHVIGALLRKFHEAKKRMAPSLTLWGSGRAQRDFLYVEDLARAVVMYLLQMDNLKEPVMNIGSGQLTSIRELSSLLAEVTGYQGALLWDETQPDGSPAKSLDSREMNALGWSPTTDIREGLAETYRWYLQHHAS